MLQYIVILLDDTCPSFCHYDVERSERYLMPLETLKEGIRWSMKENLMIQFVFPDYSLPEKYIEAIESIDHFKFYPSLSSTSDEAEVLIYNGVSEILLKDELPFKVSVLRLAKAELFENYEAIKELFTKVPKLNLIITDVDTFGKEDFDRYKTILTMFADALAVQICADEQVQLNVLTDRMLLCSINECGAGSSSITLAPDGKFYICPAFYQSPKESETALEKTFAVGSLTGGLNIKNKQLYDIDHAILCRNCDAYQCRRCVWLNRKTTWEVNTPSHEQCVVAHLERNTSRYLIEKIKEVRPDVPVKEIKEVDYLDPFDILKI